MSRKIVPPALSRFLLVASLVLPIAVCLVIGVASLLGTLGDAAGQTTLNRIALAGGVLWALALACLVLAQAVASLDDSDDGA